MGLGLCVHPAAKGDLITGQRRALSSQRRPLGIGLGTKPLPDGAPASGLPPLRHKLRGAEVGEAGRLQLVSGGHIHVSVHVHHQPQPPSKHGCRGCSPPSVGSSPYSFIHPTDGPGGAEEHLVDEGVTRQLGDGWGLPVWRGMGTEGSQQPVGLRAGAGQEHWA